MCVHCHHESSATQRKKLGKYVIGRVHTIQGDPAHMDAEKRKLRHVIRTDGCPTDWDTWAFNDTNLPDLHNYKILPYRPDDKDGPADPKTRKRMTWDNPASSARKTPFPPSMNR